MMFKHGMSITPSGNAKPCCQYQDKNTHNINEVDKWQPKFAKLFDQSLSNEWLPGCSECKRSEEETGHSIRTESLQRYDDSTSPGLKFWDLKISNTCNLMCRMCGPSDSSTWAQNVKNNNVAWTSEVIEAAGRSHTWHNTFLPVVKQQLTDIDVIKFTGGEPMLVKHVKEVIQHLIDTNISKSTTLKITTNATVEYDYWWQELVQHFKYIMINLSIDGIGSRFEYQRAGSNWKEVERNILLINKQKQHPNFECAIGYTSTSINAAVTAKTQQWAEDNNVTFYRAIEVCEPDYLTYASLDYHLREEYNIVSDTVFDPLQLEKLKTQMAFIDSIYGTDFKTECPEFFR